MPLLILLETLIVFVIAVCVGGLIGVVYTKYTRRRRQQSEDAGLLQALNESKALERELKIKNAARRERLDSEARIRRGPA